MSKLWRAKTASYIRTESSVSFLSYFSSTTPDSEHKCARLKTALFLQVSQLYDAKVIYDKLLPHKEIMQFEFAILEGKVRTIICFFSCPIFVASLAITVRQLLLWSTIFTMAYPRRRTAPSVAKLFRRGSLFQFCRVRPDCRFINSYGCRPMAGRRETFYP